ncbi:asparaginase [Prosthecomicrobium hirschii]|uniref:asparaginase n=1 Tax=Prosthecodimorpha hirschii TaxID=665126 RepID=UPI00112C4A90|nr:asparaginase [Prosthecomicrobium hirschii]TPQ49095.1 asparaginase [Prosthecomicrobium hirschii]
MPVVPILVEVLRGSLVESAHRASVVVSDAEGRVRLGLGDTARAVFPRSAVKIVQALPLVESGAADAYGFGAQDLALAAASHNGEDWHVATAAAMLARAHRSEADLECGAHWPARQEDCGRLHVAGLKPGALHNNCSGKHAGFVCYACHAGIDPKGYTAVDHPVQQAAKAALEDVFGTVLGAESCGIDGCSIPTWAIPLDRLATGMARLATGQGLAPGRAAAARRIMEASIAEPFMVAGTKRFCTDFMTALGGVAYAKTGAEGVFCAAIPSLGLGIAVKCDDGASRAAEVVVATVIAALLGRSDAPELERFLRPVLTNWNRMTVGGLRPSAELVEAAATLAP